MVVSTLPLWKGVDVINLFQKKAVLYDTIYVTYDATLYWHATRILYGLQLVKLKRIIPSKVNHSCKFAV